jgi:hypothetical protein
MSCTVSGCTSTRSLATFTEVLRLTTKWTLVDAAGFSTREWQTHVVKFEYSAWTNGTHVLDGILVTNVI